MTKGTGTNTDPITGAATGKPMGAGFDPVGMAVSAGPGAGVVAPNCGAGVTVMNDDSGSTRDATGIAVVGVAAVGIIVVGLVVVGLAVVGLNDVGLADAGAGVDESSPPGLAAPSLPPASTAMTNWECV